jgi:hypothetical protein
MHKYGLSILAGILGILLTGGGIVTAAEVTRLENLRQPPLNTTMMGVLKSASDYYGLGLSTAMLYGLSGHAFLINIHVELCPSGPYVWKREFANPLIENMGMKMTDLGSCSPKSGKDERTAVEQRLRDALNSGIPCSLLNLENQIIYGYDESGFFTAQPWAPRNQFPPARLTFGTWIEFGDEFHTTFYRIDKVKPVNRQAAILASLDYAIGMFKNPMKHSTEAYGVGPKAYDNWIKAVPAYGAEHGNWWNAIVWCECRYLAAKYFEEIGKENTDVSDLCSQLRNEYLKISGNLLKISNREMIPEEKIALLLATKKLETDAIENVEKLAAAMRTQVQY